VSTGVGRDRQRVGGRREGGVGVGKERVMRESVVLVTLFKASLVLEKIARPAFHAEAFVALRASA